MRKIILALTALLTVFLITSCIEKNDSKSIIGFGTINRDNGNTAIKYYQYTLYLNSPGSYTVLKTGERVFFEGTTTQEYDETTYQMDVNQLSYNITKDIIDYESIPEVVDSVKGTAFISCNSAFISRDTDKEGNKDYFNIASFYNSTTDIVKNKDAVYLTYDPEDQVTDTVTLWLRHYQLSQENTNTTYVNFLSVPINNLQRFGKDGSKNINIKLKYIDLVKRDTTESEFVYSFE